MCYDIYQKDSIEDLRLAGVTPELDYQFKSKETESSLFVEKFKPKDFFELLSDDVRLHKEIFQILVFIEIK